MADPADKSDEQVREGTNALQQIADDVEAERERAGSGTPGMDNDASETESEPGDEDRKDYAEPGVDPLLTRRLPEQR